MKQNKIQTLPQATTEAFSSVAGEEMSSEGTEKEMPIDRIKEISMLLKLSNLWGLNYSGNDRCRVWGIIVMIIAHLLVLLSFCHALYFANTEENVVFKITSFVVVLGQFMALVNYYHFKRNSVKIYKILENLPVSYGAGIYYRPCRYPLLFRILALFLDGILLYGYSAWFINQAGNRSLFDRFGVGSLINNISSDKARFLDSAVQFLVVIFLDIPSTLIFLQYSTICRILQREFECFKKMIATSVNSISDIYKTYNDIWNATKGVNNIYANLLFWWMLVVILEGIFYGSVGLKMIMAQGENFWGIYYLVLVFFITISFVDATLSASAIPSEASEISNYATGVMISSCPETCRFATTMYFKNTLETPQMTVGESTGINHGLLFTVFGTIATYFVVVMQTTF